MYVYVHTQAGARTNTHARGNGFYKTLETKLFLRVITEKKMYKFLLTPQLFPAEKWHKKQGQNSAISEIKSFGQTVL